MRKKTTLQMTTLMTSWMMNKQEFEIWMQEVDKILFEKLNKKYMNPELFGILFAVTFCDLKTVDYRSLFYFISPY